MESILRKVAMATSASAFEQSQRVYSVFGGGPTMRASSYGGDAKTLILIPAVSE